MKLIYLIKPVVEKCNILVRIVLLWCVPKLETAFLSESCFNRRIKPQGFYLNSPELLSVNENSKKK